MKLHYPTPTTRPGNLGTNTNKLFLYYNVTFHKLQKYTIRTVNSWNQQGTKETPSSAPTQPFETHTL